jgi:hypothetical protein
VLPSLGDALDHLELASNMPAGSEGLIVTYSTGAEVALPRGPLARVTGKALGSQRVYRGRIGNDLVEGVSLALSELERSWAPRKALIVIGDGNDTNDEAAKLQLATLKREAALQNIHTFAITYKSPVSGDGNTIGRMVPAASAFVVNSRDGIAAQLEAIVDRLNDLYYVTFDVAQLPFDGHAHDLTVRVGETELDPVTLSLPRRPAHHAWWGWWWLAELAIGCGLVAGLALLWRWRAGTAARAV